MALGVGAQGFHIHVSNLIFTLKYTYFEKLNVSYRLRAYLSAHGLNE